LRGEGSRLGLAVEAKGTGDEGGILLADARGGKAIGVEEHVEIVRAEFPGVMPPDMPVRIEYILAESPVVGAVTLEDPMVLVVVGPVGQDWDERRTFGNHRRRSCLPAAIPDVIGIIPPDQADIARV